MRASGHNRSSKTIFIEEIIRVLEKYDLIDIWIIRNSSSKRFIFRKTHFSEKYLDYIFILYYAGIVASSKLSSYGSNHFVILFLYNKSFQ